MPVFASDFKTDISMILDLAEGVADYWNENGGLDRGIRAYTSEEAAEFLSHDADAAMAFFPPEHPGAFKRVAALLVLSRLTPLFSLAAPNVSENGPKPVSEALDREWLPKLCFLLIKPAFASLSVLDAHGVQHCMSDWRGFPSLHSKAEFLLWLEWLCDYPLDSVSEDEKVTRRGRMILATSLILEATYYQQDGRSKLCGACDRNLGSNTGPIIFDAILAFNERKRKGLPVPGEDLLASLSS